MNIDQINFHIEFGRDSGIPDCCINFWITEYIPLFYSNHSIILFYHNSIPTECQYIPCPDCLEKRSFIQIKTCGPKREIPFGDEPIYLRKNWKKF